MRDVRRYALQTRTRLIFGGLLFIVIISEGLIYLFYGKQPALFGLICMLAGLAPLLMIYMVLWVIEIIVKRQDGKE